jgi:chaperone required for assembly of F1-ATPase
MRDILDPGHQPSEPDPVKRAQNAMARHPLPRRFYKTVSVAEEDGRFAIKLDGRGARTPARAVLSLPTADAAVIVAAEWDAQADVINPLAMPATRLVNSALDGVSTMMAEVAAEITGYAASDLVCYRAGMPDGLVRQQSLHWDPVIAWARVALTARFLTVEGILHTAQPPETLERVRDAVLAHQDPIALAGLHVMTTISGSCLLALMAAAGALTVDDVWAAATVDEAWSETRWGHDAEAAARMALLREDFATALALLKAVG